ncbi:MAG TPA: sulfatase-like hydrolase/transferase [Pirellulales bacterium]|nr:sulfatase-like hydrolase/transferase [Pirellulales bacterium]
MLLSITAVSAAEPARPNILWLSSEDHGPHMGCYGDEFATTPKIDALAARGMVYRHCWSNAPVCAPARTCIISGMYPPSTGAEHMRSMVPYPAGKQMFPQYLREAGYYCTNNSKEDYNLKKPGQVWDESSGKAHWKNRASGQPFFAVFNCTKSHESQIRKRPYPAVHDPAKVRVPAYHPDTPEVRQDWAQYYDCVSEADADAGKHLDEMVKAGLADDTIVFYFADHGSGMPRNKRWPRESGLHVPLIVYIPEKFAHLRPDDYTVGGSSDRLVSFVDFAPTVLSLAGIEPPEWMQGGAFLGQFQASPRAYNFGFRGRMDERYDLVRCATDGRYVYIRNYRPDKIYGQHLAYMWATPTTVVWNRLFHEGKLSDEQAAFWKTKPAEELYDLTGDPDEVHNLAGDAQHAETRERLASALRAHTLTIRDVGFLPEGEMHRRSAGSTPYDMGHDPDKYPMERVFETAELASSQDPSDLAELKPRLHDGDAAVRYWAVLGHLMRGLLATADSQDALVGLLDDSSPDVQIAAAEALVRFGSAEHVEPALALLVQKADWRTNDVFTVMAALNAIYAIEDKAAPVREVIIALPNKGDAPDKRYGEYPSRILRDLRGEADDGR